MIPPIPKIPVIHDKAVRIDHIREEIKELRAEETQLQSAIVYHMEKKKLSTYQHTSRGGVTVQIKLEDRGKHARIQVTEQEEDE